MKSTLVGALLALTIPASQPVPRASAVQALQACLYAEGLDLIGRMTPPDDVADLVLVRCDEPLEDYPGNESDVMQSFLAKYTDVYNELKRQKP